ncbi:MAG TPA: PP2C family protein-serine/threonine phosphatase [Candidatus Aminicenantes bacterium]|nr:PP2C family protein-serine/threonine phosphatase [Candidatus Aminicenantes bacterium]
MGEAREETTLAAARKQIKFLAAELRQFNRLVRNFEPPPGELPEVPSIDIYGKALPRNGHAGGDHIIYVDFKKRYRMDKLIAEAPEALKGKLRATAERAGIAVIDVEGHDYGSAFIASVFHQAFLLGVAYELRFFGEITTTLFDNVNTRFFNSSGIAKTLTMVYGEITANGTFRFLSAAHPPPLVFSNEFDRLVAISEERLVSFPQIGTMPSRGNSEKTVPLLGVKEKYTVNEISLMGRGDILLLYSDGLSDHRGAKGQKYFPARLEEVLKANKHLAAREIFQRIQKDMIAFNPKISDDVTIVVIKKT